jgi:citrate lyase alpha subunit
MQQHIYYTKFALRFADMQISELVSVFNSQVQSRAWSSMRAYHDRALIDEFQNRGIDISAIKDGNTTSFAHHIRCDIENNSLVAIG